MLVRLGCDRDWRVRAAAFTALDRLGPFERLPARDTPAADREAMLLNWLDRYAVETGYDLCDIFARAPTAQFGSSLVQRCLECHAGPTPSPGLASDRCLECHAAIHQQWDRSAHANSLTHLVLPTVDPVTRSQGNYEFAVQRGMSCIACHEPQDDHAVCVAQFAARGCADCHADADEQWAAWSTAPRLEKASWPPGSLQPAPAGPIQSCIDCHMPGQSHTWGARRDLALLASGLDVSIRRESEGRVALIVTNLAGHSYPTGSTRRALEIWVALDHGEPYRLASLSPDAATRDTTPVDTALTPAEQRRWLLPGQPSHITYRLVYVRDRFSSKSYSVEITSMTRRLQ